jgi:membrane-associated HD superfamily phosphohydrolase
MKIRYLFLLCLFSFQITVAQTLSPTAEISVLTIGPGNNLNDAFGHNGFRIKDNTQGLDIVFDYGRFPFNEPGFYLNFARGKLNYSIGEDSFNDVKNFYIWQNRTIKEQLLNLNQNEKQKLFNYLLNNYKPENRAYLYDFFYDNCATKIRDVANTALNNSITFYKPDDYKPQTFRTLIQNNLNKNSWGSLGIDIALGSVIDREASPEEQMFLPENIHRFFSKATLQNGEPLVRKSETLYTEKEKNKSANLWSSPLVILSLIALGILWITYSDYKKNKRTKWLDITLFTITGLIGVFLLLLWFATDHSATAHNYNLLWAFALNVFMVGQLCRTQPKPWFSRYLKFLVIMLCLLVFHWLVGVQVFAVTLIPLLLAFALRYVFLIRHFKSISVN